MVTVTGVGPLRPFDPETIGPYHLLGHLGSGGMGEVYLGRDRRGRLAAVKLVHDGHAGDPRFRARFAREVDIARSIRVARSAAVLDADPDAAVPWLATEYVAGPSLEKLVTANGPMSAPTARVLAARLADSLAELHAQDVVHRDVKPSNVLIGPDGPHLIDFGIARAADVTSITRTGAVLGAPGYMSPEQALGAVVGPESDVFSLAAVVVFAVTGHGPFGAAASPVAMLRRIVDEPSDLQAVPHVLRRVLEPCLAKEPAARPTAARLATLLAERRDRGDHWPPPGIDQLVPGVPDLPAAPAERAVGRRRFLGVAALGVAVAAGVAAGIAVGAGRGEPGPASGVLRWKFDVPPRGDRVGLPEGVHRLSSGPDVVIADTDERIYALDARSGEVRWESALPDNRGVRRTTCVGDSVYSHNSYGVFALDAASGDLRWEQDGAELLHATPTVLFARTMSDRSGPAHELFALDPATGTTRWRRPVPIGAGAGPWADKITMEVADTRGRLHAGIRATLTTFDAATGTVQWEAPWPGQGGGVDAHDDAVVQVQSDRVVSFDAASGAHRWTYPLSYEGYYLDSSTGRPVVHDGAVFVSAQRLYALDVGTGRLLWDVEPPSGYAEFSPALIALDRTLYAVEVSSCRLQLCGYDVDSGDLRWSLPFDGCVVGTNDLRFTATGGSVYLGVNSSSWPDRATVYAVSG